MYSGSNFLEVNVYRSIYFYYSVFQILTMCLRAKLKEHQVEKDDQKALRRALVVDMGLTSSHVLAGLMGAFYPLDKGGLGNFPCITYLVTDQVHLLHSFSQG